METMKGLWLEVYSEKCFEKAGGLTCFNHVMYRILVKQVRSGSSTGLIVKGRPIHVEIITYTVPSHRRLHIGLLLRPENLTPLHYLNLSFSQANSL